jgi:uncharacterized protein DUF11
MRRTLSIRRPIGVVLAMSLATALFVILWTRDAFGACGSNLDIALSASAAPGSGGDVIYTFAVANHGLSCAQGVKLHADLGSGFVSFSSSDSWSCPTPPRKVSVDCVLQTDLNAGSSSSVAIEASPPTQSNVTAHGFASANSPTDPQPSNNNAWVALATSLLTDPQGPNAQTTGVTRPDKASISAQEVSPGSPEGSGVPAPCEPTCVESLESIFATPPTDPGQFPGIHIAIILRVRTNQTNNTIPVYRFNHETHVWQALPGCDSGDPISPDTGCVKSVVIDKGVATMTTWTSHNGHFRA